jgi:hypothetical protein
MSGEYQKRTVEYYLTGQEILTKLLKSKPKKLQKQCLKFWKEVEHITITYQLNASLNFLTKW